MNMLVAASKPFKHDEVRETLSAIGVHGITFTETKRFARQNKRPDRNSLHQFSENQPRQRYKYLLPIFTANSRNSGDAFKWCMGLRVRINLVRECFVTNRAYDYLVD
jgi:hypothetical protein